MEKKNTNSNIYIKHKTWNPKGKFAYKLPAIYLLFITGDMSFGFANSCSCECMVSVCVCVFAFIYLCCKPLKSNRFQMRTENELNRPANQQASIESASASNVQSTLNQLAGIKRCSNKACWLRYRCDRSKQQKINSLARCCCCYVSV